MSFGRSNVRKSTQLLATVSPSFNSGLFTHEQTAAYNLRHALNFNQSICFIVDQTNRVISKALTNHDALNSIQ